MKTLTTKSEIFKAAHKLTKETRKASDSYSATFSICLKYIYSQLKNSVMEQVKTPAQVLQDVKDGIRLEESVIVELTIPYSDMKKHTKSVKNYGMKYNSVKKCYEHSCKKLQESWMYQYVTGVKL